MTMNRAIFLAVLALALGACATTSYESRRSTSSGDGSNSDAAWTALDTDKDGYLSIDELEQQHAVGLLQDLYVADSDHDGKVSRTEWNAWWPLMTKTQPSENMAQLNASSAPSNGIRAN
jgi:Ca2+-binding EF-hand superfamily protein